MKRTYARLWSLLLVLAMLAAMIPAVLAANVGVTVDQTMLTVGQTTTAHVMNADHTEASGTIVYTSSSDAVSISGAVLTAEHVGTAEITATLDGNAVPGSVTVTVTSAVSAIAISPEAILIDADTYTAPVVVTANLTGASTGDVVTASSQDPSVVTVPAQTNVSGTMAQIAVTPLKVGSTTITLSCNGQSAAVPVAVTADAAKHTLSFEKTSMTVEKGKTATNKAATQTKTDVISYESSDTNFATVDQNGTVTGLAASSYLKIRATAKTNGIVVDTAEYSLEVAAEYKIVLNAPSSVTAGRSDTVSASVYKYNLMKDTFQLYTDDSVTLTWSAYQSGIAAFRGETASKAVTTTTRSGSSSVTLDTYSSGTSASGARVPLQVTMKIGDTTYTADSTAVTVLPAFADAFSVEDEDYFDPDDFSKAVDGATGSNAARLASISVTGSSGGYVYYDGSRVSTEKYTVSGTRGNIARLYFRANSTSSVTPYFTYTGYDANGMVLATGKVTIGGLSVDMEYSTTFGGSVRFLESDFNKAFSGKGKVNEKLDYVNFFLKNAVVVMNNKTYNLNDSGNASIFGWAYTSSKLTTKLDSTDRCCYEAGKNELDLDDVTYVAGTYTTKYTVYIPYTATGTSGSTYNGYCAVSVTNGDAMTATGASFKTLGVVEQVLSSYPSASYVALRQPTANEGRLLYSFNSIVNENYTAIRYTTDVFYLSSTNSRNLQLANVYFLPAADCASQIKLTVTVYNSSDRQLGTMDLTVKVAAKTASSVFTDVNARTCSWAADAVDFMNYFGLVKGTSASTFNYSGNMTRGDFVLILYRNAGQPSVSGITNPFRDVSSSDYYYAAVLWAYKNGVVNGTSSTTFSPKGKITREQIASILWRLAGEPSFNASLRSYTDYASVSAYAEAAMGWAVGSGYVKGSGAKLNPKNNATRAEVAVMLHRYLTK